MDIVFALGFVGLIGLVVGSFLNVAIHRVPAGASVVRPPSACPTCGHEIAVRDNIPVVSWVLLRGKCRHCRAGISVRYPFVELATAGLFVGTAAVIGEHWTLPAYLWLGAVTFALAVIDLDTKRLPDALVFPGTIGGLVLLALGALLEGEWAAYGRGVAAGAIYFGALLVIALLAKGGFGFGDVKMSFMLGLGAGYQSWDALVVATFGAFFIGGVVSIVLLVTRRVGRKDSVPFGPSMVLAAYLAVWMGSRIMGSYLA